MKVKYKIIGLKIHAIHSNNIHFKLYDFSLKILNLINSFNAKSKMKVNIVSVKIWCENTIGEINVE